MLQRGGEMSAYGLVFIGIDVVADALDVAESRRWTRTRAPRGLWRRLGVRTGAVLRHPDAPFLVAVAPADTGLKGAAKTRADDLRVTLDPDLFDEIVDDSPVAEELIRALLSNEASVQAA
jgi:hypothetical protein